MTPITLSINSTITRGAFQRDLSTSQSRPCNRQWLAVNSPYATTNESIRTEIKAIADLFQFPHEFNDLLLCGNGAGYSLQSDQPQSFRSNVTHYPKQNTSERFKPIISNLVVFFAPFSHVFMSNKEFLTWATKFMTWATK